jgi:hypothetical protein
VRIGLVTAVTVGVAAVLMTSAACGSKSSTATSSESSSSKSSSSSASSSATSTAAAQDYSKLLIDASEIVAPDDTFTAQEPTVNPNGKPGVATVFSNGGDTREIGDTILVLPSAEDAATALNGAAATLPTAVSGGEPGPAQVGSNGTIVSGTSPDGSKSVTVVLFTQGKAFTTLEFDGGPSDPVPAEFALDVANKQDQKISAGLS